MNTIDKGILKSQCDKVKGGIFSIVFFLIFKKIYYNSVSRVSKNWKVLSSNLISIHLVNSLIIINNQLDTTYQRF